MSEKSKIIVIEGLDGSGKATQTKLLAEKLQAQGRRVRQLSFPDYESRGSALVQMYLSGEFGSRPEDVNAYAASAFYAVDRAASFLKDWQRDYREGALLLSDRYCTSNIIYQMAKVSDDERDAFIRWQADFEYDKLGKDLHESNLGFLLSCRRSALYAAERCGWHIINCCRDGVIRPIEEIAKDIEEVMQGII